MKKFYWFMIILFIVFIGLIVISYLVKDTIPEVMFLEEGDIIPNNICKNLDKIIFVEKAGCPACVAVKPRIEKLEKELNLDIKRYNLAVEQDRTELISKFILPRYVPTLIKDCNVYVGALSEENLREILK